MKSLSAFALMIIFGYQLQGQNISGKVIDFSNGEPLVYVSIGVMETSKGTITDEKGNFNLDVTGQSIKSPVRFSMIGYQSQNFTIEELSKFQNIIKLKYYPIDLAPITIKPYGKIKEVGTKDYTILGGFDGWSGANFGKGYEIGLKIELGALPVRIKSLHFRLYKQTVDSSLFRLHIREIDENMPLNELLNKNILIPVTKKSGWFDIDLSKYNLVFSGDIVLSIEWIKVVGIHMESSMKINDSKQASPNVLFNIKRKQGCTYHRWGTEANWVKDDSSSPSFYLTVQEL
jgi:hypothetical protein